MEEIKITETETLMSDGSTHVHCEAEHNGQRIVATYNISAQCVDKVAFRHTASPAMIRAMIDARTAPSVVVSFNPRTCDPMGEGEALAEAITDAVYESDAGAIGALLQAAVCLGAEILDMDDDPETLATKIFENDTWRERLKTAIATAETWIAEVDASKPTE